MTWCEKEWPNTLSTCKIKHSLDIAARDVNCSTVNVTGIKKCTWYWQLLIFLKLTGIYNMPFESGHTLNTLEVWERLWCLFSTLRKESLDVNTPKTYISASAASYANKRYVNSKLQGWVWCWIKYPQTNFTLNWSQVKKLWDLNKLKQFANRDVNLNGQTSMQ